ncbi:hypothetical protein AB5I41_27615 [Sphingomonas sp. MMS24-JH45]
MMTRTSRVQGGGRHGAAALCRGRLPVYPAAHFGVSTLISWRRCSLIAAGLAFLAASANPLMTEIGYRQGVPAGASRAQAANPVGNATARRIDRQILHPVRDRA